MGYMTDTMGGPVADAFRVDNGKGIYKNGGQVGFGGVVKFDGDIGSVDTAALLHGAGTSATPVSTTSGANFMGYWVRGNSTGDVRGLYMRLYLANTAAASGEAGRFFTTVDAGAKAAAAHGAHISLSFTTTGYCSGLGVASRCTLHLPDQANWSTGGTYAAVQAEIYSDGAASDAGAATSLSYFRVISDGHANGLADVDDDVALFDISGHTIGTGNMIDTSATEANYSHSIRIKINGGIYYLMVAQTQG